MSHRKVMIIDDDTDIRESLTEVLREIGYDVVAASNGREALDLLEGMSDRPCLILLDLMMPVLDGTGFREIQRQHVALAPIPVVVITANRDADARVEAMQVAGYLRKPMELDDLVAVVGAHCN
jgi:DNA-binding response OmpR family regulator